MTNRAPCILSISYDESLLRTREWILKSAGFEVTSALGYKQASAHAMNNAFDLVIVGHSIPRDDKTEIVNLVKSHNHTRILSLRRHGDAPVTGVDHSVESSLGPDALLEAVKTLLNRNPSAASDS